MEDRDGNTGGIWSMTIIAGLIGGGISFAFHLGDPLRVSVGAAAISFPIWLVLFAIAYHK